MNILIEVLKIPFTVVNLLIFGTTAFLDLFNIAKEFFNPIKE